MITVSNISKSYNGKAVVNIPSLEIGKGEIIGLVGNNGAGKTTFFRLLLDLIRADKGEVKSKEKVITTTETWKDYTAAYLDEGFLIDYLRPEEYFSFIGQINKRTKDDVAGFVKTFEAFFDGSVLRTGKYIRDLSNGNQFKVGIAGCLLQKPEILILDEPFANLDPSSQVRLIKMLKEMRIQQGMTVLISSHGLSHIADVCTRILVMEKGKIVKDIHTTDDTLAELEAYFEV
jgi:ABC-2 type transport system ATP-binding protein